EFISLGMSAEIVVVINNQYAGFRIGFPEEMRRREAANTASHDDQIETLSSFSRLPCFPPKIAVTYAVGCFKRADVTATQAGKRRWVIVWRLLWVQILVKRRQHMRRKNGSACRNCHSIQKIATSNSAIHSQVFIGPQVFLVRVAHSDFRLHVRWRKFIV